MVQVRAVATADDSNQKDLDAEREVANWGATPEEEKFEATKLEALAHNIKRLRESRQQSTRKKIYHTLSQSRELRGVVSFTCTRWSGTLRRGPDVLHYNSGHRQRD